jgi:glycosyltransferase involved in cell wall biosynthesis
MDGIKWFLLNVAPSLDIKIKVVGRGLDSLKSFEDQKNIDIVGEVKDLSKWYQSCLCVIAPIFDGSGMKTKVAEALMFGRKVVGTKESFTGYEVFHDEIGWVCTSAKDFIQAIEIAQDSIINPFHENLREIFVKEFSQEAATLRLEKILQSSY